MWRPKDWPKILVKICGENPHHYDVHFVEAGADAIMKALRKKGKHVELTEPLWVQLPVIKSNGTLVFIPDEESSDARPTS